TVRQLPALVMAADLIRMDRDLTGSRAGFTDTTWATWLKSLYTKPIGTHPRWKTIRSCSDDAANNWGAAATTARIAIAVYLKDTAELATAVARFRRFLGDRSQATQFRKTGDFDTSYAYVPSGMSVSSDWTAVNNGGGSRLDGLIVEDISRSSLTFSLSGLFYDSTGLSYTHEAFGSLVLSAIILDHAGYQPWGWSNEAIRRVADWLGREDKVNGTYSVQRWAAWAVNRYYNTAHPTTAAQMGRNVGFTDWLYA
ncbi:MAG TPA: alginate lyase family protein, partial [Conexibacter sp.]|nr:alginate lyase family protein [Conexibacter sp.]